MYGNSFPAAPTLETTTNQNGEYRLQFHTPLTLTGPRTGKDTLCVDAGAAGYETRPDYAPESVNPKRTEYKNFDFKLEKGKLIRGTVVDEQNQPIAGARVSVHLNDNGDWVYFCSRGVTTTAPDGKFQLYCSTDSDVLGPTAWLQVDKPNVGVSFICGFQNKGRQGDLGTLVLRQGSEVHGRIMDADGQGVPNCEVHWSWMSRSRGQARTGSDGRYILAGVTRLETIKEFLETQDKLSTSLFHRKRDMNLELLAKIQVYALPDSPKAQLELPTCKLLAPGEKSVNAPDLVFGKTASASGTLIPARSSPALKGLMVRLDENWNQMAEADAEGKFFFPSVPEGKHRLTVYLPTNLRYDRGIGRTEINVQPQQKLAGLTIQLDELAEARLQILDAHGDPLEGITAAATWNRAGTGGWTEGTRSGSDGWAVLYLYPGDTQYVRGMDMDAQKLVADGFVEVKPKTGEVIDNLRVTMVPVARITMRVIDEQQQPVKGKVLEGMIDYADGTQRAERVKTDTQGRVEIRNVTPGAVKVSLKTLPLELSGAIDQLTEIKPDEVKDMGALTLKPVQFGQLKGRLAGSPSFANLEGFKIRMDLNEWQPLVPTDAQGNFSLEKVPAGKHRLTAYLPFNLRTDRGVGHVAVEVKGGSLENVILPLETLATVHLKIQDPVGTPLEGISAAAWWSKDHSGVFTEGSKSDKEGRASLFLYPDEQQYLGAHDWNGVFNLKAHHAIKLKPGEAKEYTVIMQTAATAQGK